jgi:hypothetical protein
MFLKLAKNYALLYCVSLILIMNKTKAVRNTKFMFFFVSLILQFFSDIYMMRYTRGFHCKHVLPFS